MMKSPNVDLGKASRAGQHHELYANKLCIRTAPCLSLFHKRIEKCWITSRTYLRPLSDSKNFKRCS